MKKQMNREKVFREFYKNFGLISYESQKHLDAKEILRTEKLRDKKFLKRKKQIKKKDLVPDIVLFTFLRSIKGRKNFKLQVFDEETQSKILKFWINSGKNDMAFLLIECFCNGIFYTNREFVQIADMIISDNDLEKFCIFYGVKGKDREEKLYQVIDKQAEMFAMLDNINVKCWESGINMIEKVL